ncbi:MAG: hypothetical protein HC769_28065 [Cyanobacteria bacterium CRU_2_1]|nr:hypothetical protein [Cyanobacteria bacterium RU_5_0]NJR62336.1 hypothetical protein [Cyanobacteria bacterium CRU_2_1]
MRVYTEISAALFSLASSLAVVASVANPQIVSAQDGATTFFFCGMDGGVPTTLAHTDEGDVPIIRWTSNFFNDSGWTPQARCEEVSERFQKYYEQEVLDFITTGVINGEPVVCVATEQDGPCVGLLLTLRRGVDDPDETLQQLFNIRDTATGPIYQSSQGLYINVEEFLRSAPVQEEGSESSEVAPATPFEGSENSEVVPATQTVDAPALAPDNTSPLW